MPFNIERKRLFVGTVQRVVKKYEEARTDGERENAMIEALVVRDKFDEQDYPEISASTEQPTAIVTVGLKYNNFLEAMDQNHYSEAYKSLRAVNNLIESFQA